MRLSHTVFLSKDAVTFTWLFWTKPYGAAVAMAEQPKLAELDLHTQISVSRRLNLTLVEIRLPCFQLFIRLLWQSANLKGL